MSTARPLSPECSDLINRRLDDIDRVLLLAELPRAERSEIVQLVESQIYEMLAVIPDAPEPVDVAAVLQKLDPPQAYAPPEYRARVETAHSSLRSTPTPAGPTISAFSILAAMIGGMSLLLVASAFVYVMLMVFANDGDMQVIWVLLGGSLAFALLASGFGAAGLQAIRRSSEKLTGVSLAAIGLSSLALSILNAVLLLAILYIELLALLLLGVLAYLVLNAGVIFGVWRLAKSWGQHAAITPPNPAMGRPQPVFA